MAVYPGMAKIKQIAQYAEHAELFSIQFKGRAATRVSEIAQPQQHAVGRLQGGRT